MSVKLISVLASVWASVAMAGDLRLVMVEQPGCHWCDRWNTEIAPIWPKTTEGQTAPLARQQLGTIAKGQFDAPVLFTPTFILTHDGTEVGRIEGYPGEDFFWPLLGDLISQTQETSK